VIKAFRKGDAWLADRIYSSIPAGMVGRGQEIEIGPMSGQANVVFWLQAHGIAPAPELVKELFDAAKGATATLDEGWILERCRARQPS
jgi:2-isopropylmalate synthase